MVKLLLSPLLALISQTRLKLFMLRPCRRTFGRLLVHGYVVYETSVSLLTLRNTKSDKDMKGEWKEK